MIAHLWAFLDSDPGVCFILGIWVGVLALAWLVRRELRPAPPAVRAPRLDDADPIESPGLPAWRNSDAARDAATIRALIEDLMLQRHYPALTAEQRRDVLQRRHQEAA